MLLHIHVTLGRFTVTYSGTLHVRYIRAVSCIERGRSQPGLYATLQMRYGHIWTRPPRKFSLLYSGLSPPKVPSSMGKKRCLLLLVFKGQNGEMERERERRSAGTRKKNNRGKNWNAEWQQLFRSRSQAILSKTMALSCFATIFFWRGPIRKKKKLRKGSLISSRCTWHNTSDRFRGKLFLTPVNDSFPVSLAKKGGLQLKDKVLRFWPNFRMSFLSSVNGKIEKSRLTSSYVVV